MKVGGGTSTRNGYNNDYSSMLGSWTKEGGNDDFDPLFVGSGDYHLQSDSPCIDVGDNSAPQIQNDDFEGNPRIVDGDVDGNAIVDMGADEYGTILYVKTDGVDPTDCGGGTNWETAFRTITKAEQCASPGDEIWVKQGVYYPSSDYVYVGKTVGIYGGFAGTETSRNQRDWQENETSVDGGASGRGFLIMTDCILDGFTIANGQMNYGGGIYVSGGTPTITNCTLSGNTANTSGGGIYNTASSIIINCSFSGNEAGDGAGIYNSNSEPSITNCSFSGNTASGGQGGGIYNNASDAVISHCTFSGNEANRGGGIYNYHSEPIITNCIITGCKALVDGGGIFNGEQCYNAVMTNCTLSGNTATDSGGGIYDQWGDLTITNCILWGNEASDGAEIYIFVGSPTITYSDIGGGTGESWFGTGCLDADPQFSDSGYWDNNGTPGEPSDDFWVNGDYHLRISSPCIDTGTNSAAGLPVTDFEGDDRIVDGDRDGSATVDMGADEYALKGAISPLLLLLLD